MIITWNHIIALSPLLIIGLTIIITMSSILYCRNQFRHVLLTIIGLVLAIIVLLCAIWRNPNVQDINQLIYVDNFSVLYMILIIFSSFASTVSSYTWLLRHPNVCRDEFYLLLLISSMGGMLLTIANNLVILFLGIELVSLPLLGLIGYAVFEKSAIVASVKYVVLSGIASAFLLFGIALVYAETSCLSFVEIKEVLLSYRPTEQVAFQFMLLVMIGLIMMMVGFGFKLSSVPFHSWTPDVYQGAPSVVSMYLTTGSKIAIISILIRFLLMFPEQYHKVLYIFLSSLACGSMLFGSIVAIQQDNIKRILAYSSITSSGYVLVALITVRFDFFMFQETISIYLINYLFSNIGAFGVISLMSSVGSIDQTKHSLSLYQGLFWRAPTLSVVFTIIVLSLAGIPMTLGFIGKFYLLFIGIHNQLWVLSMFILISSIISVFYYLKIITIMYLPPVNNNSYYLFPYIGFNNPTGIIVLIMATSIIVFGLYPQPIISLIHLICLN